MKRSTFFSPLIGLVLVLTVIPAGAQSPSGQHPAEHQGTHGAMPNLAGPSVMLGEQTVDGVKAMAHVGDISAQMAPMKRKENYHLMLTLSEAQTGAVIDRATVAVKIVDPATGQTGEPIPLVGMSGHFGADLILAAKGEYRFLIGTKLADGSKRQFQFSYRVK